MVKKYIKKAAKKGVKILKKKGGYSYTAKPKPKSKVKSTVTKTKDIWMELAEDVAVRRERLSQQAFYDVVDAYRRYYIGEKKDFAVWTRRPEPKWWPVSIKTYDCSLCKETFKGYGNNPWPLAEGRCCDDCNMDVIVARVAGLQERQNARASKDT